MGKRIGESASTDEPKKKKLSYLLSITLFIQKVMLCSRYAILARARCYIKKKKEPTLRGRGREKDSFLDCMRLEKKSASACCGHYCSPYK